MNYNGLMFDENEVIKFDRGIPGFEGLKSFVLREVEGNDVFKILYSIEEDTSFVVISPFLCHETYEIELSEDIISSLEIKSSDEVELYTMVTLNSEYDKITTNLKAPLVINNQKKKGEQFISDIEKFDIKHPVFKEGKLCLS